MKISKIEDCRKVYRDIILGYSVVKNPFCYLKHLTDVDLGAVENKNDGTTHYVLSRNNLGARFKDGY